MLAIVAGDQQGEKVGYAAFVAEYFAGEPIHEPTARNFYEDYLASTYSLPEYIQQTTSVL